ncbi:MAG: peptide chain release factor 2 [Deltaproteobacteria bacterium]|nr:peptide chain release factor 2 [Deltaproteobacteria bacterium]
MDAEFEAAVKTTRNRIRGLADKLGELGRHLDIDGKQQEVDKLEALATAPEFWSNQERAQKLSREKASLSKLVDGWKAEKRRLDDAAVMVDLAAEAADEGALREATADAERTERALAEMEFRRMMSGPNDAADAIVEVNAGAGGTESQDWAQMVLRMLLRYCERQGWKVELVDEQFGEEAGIKSTTFIVSGDHTFGHLRAEGGVHRLVRISPFDSNARRHTSFASVFVTPDIEQEIEIEIRPEDLRVDVYRSSGAGGQHVNKTDSAVRLTHLPTGLVVACQNERSQHKNKSFAMKVLKSRLYERARKEQEEKIKGMLATKKAISFGSQIRSYVLAPYRLVNDHRTGTKLSNVDAVLDGDIDGLIRGYLLAEATGSVKDGGDDADKDDKD